MRNSCFTVAGSNGHFSSPRLPIRFHSLIFLVITLGLTACSGGGGSHDSENSSSSSDGSSSSGSSGGGVADTTPPAVKINFPSLDGLWAQGEFVIIRGTALDDSPIESVKVNGHEVTTEDGYTTWTVSLPIARGQAISLTLEARDMHGNFGSIVDSRVINSYLGTPKVCGYITYDRRGGKVINFRHGAIATEVESGEQHYVGENSTTIGDFTYSFRYTYSPVIQSFFTIKEGSLYKFDPSDAPDVVISENGQNGIYFSHAWGAVSDDASANVYVQAFPPGGPEYGVSLYSIDANNGSRQLVSGPNKGSGPSLELFNLISVAKGRIFAASDNFEDPVRTIIEIDKYTGDRRIVSGDGVGEGDSLNKPMAFAVDENAEKAYVGDFFDELVEIDIATGDRKLISGYKESLLTNLVFEQGFGMAADSEKGQVYVSSCQANHLIAIDMKTGTRSQITPAVRGEGPSAGFIRDMQFDNVNKRIIAVGRTTQTYMSQIISVDPESGDRKILSGEGRGDGFELSAYARELEVGEDSGKIYLVDELSLDGPSVVSVDPESGDRRVVTPREGAGHLVERPGGIAVDEQKNTLYVADKNLKAIIAVDLQNGTESVISDLGIVGGGEYWELPGSITLSADKSKLYVADLSNGNIFSVELATGGRTIISGGLVGSGPPLDYVGQLQLDAARNKLVIGNTPISYSPVVFVDLKTGNREFRYFLSGIISHWSNTVYSKTGNIYLADFGNHISLYDYESTQALTLSQ